MDVAPQAAEIRALQRQIGDLRDHLQRSRRASVGLMVALVGLVGGLSMPWVTRYETVSVDARGLDGGVTAWIDGWVVIGVSLGDLGSGGWTTAIAALGPVVLAVMVAIVLSDLGPSLAKAVAVLGWVGAVGLPLTWIALAAGAADAGPGPLVAAAGSVVAAVTARSLPLLRPLVPTIPTAVSLLDSGAIRATPPPSQD